MILTPLQKLPNNVSNLGKIFVATSFEWLPKVQKITQSGHTAGRLARRQAGQVNTFLLKKERKKMISLKEKRPRENCA